MSIFKRTKLLLLVASIAALALVGCEDVNGGDTGTFTESGIAAVGGRGRTAVAT